MQLRRQPQPTVEASELVPTVTDTRQSGQPTAVKLSQIKLTFSFTPNQAPLRHYYDRTAIKAWVEADLKVNGIHQPILLRPHPSGVPHEYELVDGLTRYIATEEFLQLDTIQAVIRTLDDAQAYRAATASNTNRAGFTALEYLDHALSLLGQQLSMSPKEVKSLLYRFNNESKKKGANHIDMSSDPQLQIVTSVFDFLGQTTWRSFVANYLPLSNLPEPLAQAIRSGKIDYSKGIDLSRLKDEEAQTELLKLAIACGLSRDEIQQRVRELQSSPTKQAGEPKPLLTRLTQATKKAKQSKLWEDQTKVQTFERLMTQLEDLLQD